jgi:hypothetical protein
LIVMGSTSEMRMRCRTCHIVGCMTCAMLHVVFDGRDLTSTCPAAPACASDCAKLGRLSWSTWTSS